MADYTTISGGYDKNMNRVNNGMDGGNSSGEYIGETGLQTAAGAVETKPVNNAQSLDDLWIGSFIRSLGWKPKARGFSIDGADGSAEFSGIVARGKLVASGGFSTNVKTVSGAYTIIPSDFTILCDTSTKPCTVTLPEANSVDGQVFFIKIKNSSAQSLTVQSGEDETIDGNTSITTSSSYYTMMVQAADGNWWRFF